MRWIGNGISSTTRFKEGQSALCISSWINAKYLVAATIIDRRVLINPRRDFADVHLHAVALGWDANIAGALYDRRRTDQALDDAERDAMNDDSDSCIDAGNKCIRNRFTPRLRVRRRSRMRASISTSTLRAAGRSGALLCSMMPGLAECLITPPPFPQRWREIRPTAD